MSSHDHTHDAKNPNDDNIEQHERIQSPFTSTAGRVGSGGLPDPREVRQSLSPMASAGAEFRSVAMLTLPVPALAIRNTTDHKPAPWGTETRSPVKVSTTTTKIPGETLEESIPRLLPPPMDPTGWDLDKSQLAPLPLFFPRDLIKLEMPLCELHGVLERIPRCVRHLSIQAEYQNNPIGAQLQTNDFCELTFRLWKAEDGKNFYIDIQRRKGDHMDARKCVQQLLEAAQGHSEHQFSTSAPRPSRIDKQHILHVESLVNRAVVAPAQDSCPQWMHVATSPVSEQQAAANALDTVHAALSSNRMEMRRMGLELLSTFTDLRSTLSCTAVPCALAVLQAQPPTPDSVDKCKGIQRILLCLLQNREFEGDEVMYSKSNSISDMDFQSFMRLDDFHQVPSRSPYYVEFMSELFHLALTVLVNSLEAICCFKDQISNVEGLCSEIYPTLLDCVQRSNCRLSNGYLACKALRLLATAYPTVVGARLRQDRQAATCIGQAVQLGRARHSLLQAESEMLWKDLYHNQGVLG